MNNLTQYLSETNFIFYENEWKQQVSSIIKNKEKILFVSSEGWKRRNILNEIKTIYNSEKINYFFIDSNYPSLNQIFSILSKINLKNFDLIIALGGGSVIDTVKGLIYFQFSDQKLLYENIEDYINNENRIKFDGQELLAIPTTVGSGSEMTSFATIWDYKNLKKYSIESEFIKPKYVILDHSLLTSLDGGSLFHPIFDSFSHSFDSLSNIKSNNKSENVVDKALEILLSGLNDYEENKYSSALKSFALSSMLSGLAIQYTRTSLSHSLSYPLTLNLNIPHGLACISTIPSIFDIFKSEIKNLKLREGQINKILNKFYKFKEYQVISNYTKDADLHTILKIVGKDGRLKNFSGTIDLSIIRQIYSKIIND